MRAAYAARVLCMTNSNVKPLKQAATAQHAAIQTAGAHALPALKQR